MKCMKCGSEWNVPNSMLSEARECPFCHAQLKPSNSTVFEVLRWIVDTRGVEAFLNGGTINSILANMVKTEEKERKKIKLALLSGAGSEFHRIWLRCNGNLRDKDLAEYSSSVADMGFADDFVSYIVSAFLYAISFDSIPILNSRTDNENIIKTKTANNPPSLLVEGEYAVKLISVGSDKVKVINAVRQFAGLGLKEAKETVDGLPQIIIEHASKQAAEDLMSELQKCGAKATVLDIASYLFDRGLDHYIKEEYDEALKWFDKSADRGSLAACTIIGEIYQDKFNNYDGALAWYTKAASRGHALAQDHIGYMYNHGLGVAKDNDEALKWYRLSAEQNCPFGQNDLGYMFLYGLGVEKNTSEAIKWFRLSADNGCENAEGFLAYIYYNGMGVKQDYNEALKWYRVLANKDLASAQYELAGMYYNGLGVKADKKEAFFWYEQSANQGYSEHQRNIGFIYQYGEGVERDLDEAQRWFIMPAKQGYAPAQCEVGLMYMRGEAVTKDYSKALSRLKLAASQENAKAKDYLLSMPETSQEELEVRIGERISAHLSKEELDEFDLIKDPVYGNIKIPQRGNIKFPQWN